MAVSSLYQLLVTQGDHVWHSAGLFTVNVSGQGGIPVGLFGPANEMAFSLRFRFVDASLGMTEISRASDHFSSAPDGLFWWPRRCCCGPFGPHCWGGELGPLLGPHSPTTGGCDDQLIACHSPASRRASDPVGGHGLEHRALGPACRKRRWEASRKACGGALRRDRLFVSHSGERVGCVR